MRAVSDCSSPPRARLARCLAQRVSLWMAMLAAGGFASVAATGSATPPGGVHLASASPFVAASGGQLYLNGRPWQFTGYDAYQLPSLNVGAAYNCGGIYNTSWLDQNLDEMKSKSGATVVRTWFFQSYSADNYVQFDTVLAAAAARNIKIIPVLVNQWGDCEPGWGPQGQRPYRTLSWYQGGYKQTGDGYPLSFRDYAINMAARYADNPTIAFWQLVNEAEAMSSASGPCDNWAAGAAMRSFADDMASAMKSVDHNHLVSLGTMGGGQCGTQGTEYQYVNAGAVDICEYHDYGAPATSLPGDPWNGVSDDMRECAALGKPIFAGEVGIDASIQPDGSTPGPVTAASLQLRAALFGQKLQAQFAHHIAGFLIWSKSLGPSSSFDVGPGDPAEAVMAAFSAQLGAGGLPTARPAPTPTARGSAAARVISALTAARSASASPATSSATPEPSSAAMGALSQAPASSVPDPAAAAAIPGRTGVIAQWPPGAQPARGVAPLDALIFLPLAILAMSVWYRLRPRGLRMAS